MKNLCLERQKEIKLLFKNCVNEEARYEKIIELGKKENLLSCEFRTIENEVKGCQSKTYLKSTEKNGKIYFEVGSEALISLGLAAILIRVYSGLSPETILQCPPDYLEDLGISASLTPGRANGLYSIHLKMKQDALKILIGKKTS